MLRFVLPTESRLRRFVDAYRDAPFTYRDVGASKTVSLPAGYHVTRRSTHLGDAPEAFDAGVAALKNWAPQKRAGLKVASSGVFETGTVVAQAARLVPGVRLLAPCRVVYVDESADSFAYAYGTLKRHPESGEERFALKRTDNGVTFEIVAFIKPGSWLTRIGAPVMLFVQGRALDAYVEALRDSVKSMTGSSSA